MKKLGLEDGKYVASWGDAWPGDRRGRRR